MSETNNSRKPRFGGWLSFLGWVKGSGNLAEVTRTLSPFSAVSLEMRGDLFIEMGSDEKIRIEADDNLLEYVETEVKNGVLKVETRGGANLFFTKPIRFFLTASTLSRLNTSSSGNIHAPEMDSPSFEMKSCGSGSIHVEGLRTDSLKCEISSSGRHILKTLATPDLKVRISGSGDMIVDNGLLGNQDIHLSSGGKFIAPDVKALPERARLLEVRISGSGSVETGEINADLLDARLSSSGRLIIPRASLREIQAHISGSGNMEVEDGVVEVQEIRLSSSGKYLASGLRAPAGASSVSSAKITGSGHAELGKVNVENFEAVLESSGNLIMEELLADSLQVKSSGSGDMVVEEGRVRQMAISLNSDGKFIGSHLGSTETPAERVKVTLSGSGSGKIGSIRANLVSLSIQSSGGLTVGEVYADLLEARLDGSGDLMVCGGEAQGVDVRLDSSGKCLLADLKCKKGKVVSSGSGDTEVQVKDALEAKINSSGNLRLIGRPNLDVSVDGSGKLNQESL